MTTSHTPDYVQSRFPGADPYAPLGNPPSFPLSSTDIHNGYEFSKDELGEGAKSPQLAWENLPAGTKSLAVTCFDPDAPTGSGFWHWAAFNIPATISELPAGVDFSTIDGAVVLKGDSGIRGYYGPNPPANHAPHRYLFAVHALDVETLDIDPDATPTVLGFNLFFHTLGRAIVWGWYENTGEGEGA